MSGVLTRRVYGSNHRLDDPRIRRRDFGARPQVLDLPDPLVEFVRSGEQGDAEAAFLGVLQLLADFLGLGKDLDTQSTGTQLSGQSLVFADAVGLKQDHEDLRRRTSLL